MKGLNWFQARALARDSRAVRRDAWRKWLTLESYVWLITQPAWETQTADRRVVQQWDFGADEFLAFDWTDEPWEGGPLPPGEPPGDGGGSGGGESGPCVCGGSGSGGGGSDGGGSGSGGVTPSGNPDPIPDPGPPWWPWDPDGPQPPVPPSKPVPSDPPSPNVPTVTVELESDLEPDGPACIIHVPETCTVYVNVTIAGGPAGVGSLSVKLQGQTQLGTAFPGFSGAFIFKNIIVNPGGTITATADYGAPGPVPMTHYFGSGSYTFLPLCLLFSASFTGSMTEKKSCDQDGLSGQFEDGYQYTASYGFARQYAVNPADGLAKPAKLAAAGAEELIHWENETLPDHTQTSGDIQVNPPAAVTVDVNTGAVSNVQPTSLNLFGAGQHSETQMPRCTFDKDTSESVTV